MELWKAKHDSGQWLEIEAAEAMSTQSDFSTMNASGIMLSGDTRNQSEFREAWPVSNDDLGTESNGKATNHVGAEMRSDNLSSDHDTDRRPPGDPHVPLGPQEYFQRQQHPMIPQWPVQSPPGLQRTDDPSIRINNQVSYEPDDLSLMPEHGMEMKSVGYDPVMDYNMEVYVESPAPAEDDHQENVSVSAMEQLSKSDKEKKSRVLQDKRNMDATMRKGRPSKVKPLAEAQARAGKLWAFKADLQKLLFFSCIVMDAIHEATTNIQRNLVVSTRLS